MGAVPRVAPTFTSKCRGLQGVSRDPQGGLFLVHLSSTVCSTYGQSRIRRAREPHGAWFACVVRVARNTPATALSVMRATCLGVRPGQGLSEIPQCDHIGMG